MRMLVVRHITNTEYLVWPSTGSGGRSGLAINPRRNSTGLPPCVVQLYSDMLTLTVSKVRKLSEGFNLTVFPKSRVLGRDASFFRDSSRFDDSQPWAPLNDSSEVREVPGSKFSIICRVLTHWGNNNTILEFDATQFNRLEQLWDTLATGLWNSCRTRGDVLLRCVK